MQRIMFDRMAFWKYNQQVSTCMCLLYFLVKPYLRTPAPLDYAHSLTDTNINHLRETDIVRHL